MTGTASRVDIPLSVRVDNSAGLRRTTAQTRGRDRTIHILFEENRAGKFDVRAWGPAFPEDGGGAFSGLLELTRCEVELYVSELMSTWTAKLLAYQGPAEIGTRTWPFSDNVDLSDPRRHEDLDTAMRELAAHGDRLYRIIFRSGDAGLQEIYELLTVALRERPQVVTIHAEEMFVPWWMLYIPPEPSATSLDTGHTKWHFDGFLGYRHTIEHNFKRTPGWEFCVSASGRVRTGLNVDRRLDTRFAATPPVGPIIELFDKHTVITIRETRTDLARDISSSSFADQLIYFGCHGFAGDGSTHEAHLRLTDDEPIAASHLRSWLIDFPVRTNPVVLINACQGGRMTSTLCASFGRILLQRGANCLVGPQIEIPPAFAAAYFQEFVPRIFDVGSTVGDAVHELTIAFADKFRNPLGLAICLYRGIDTRFTIGL